MASPICPPPRGRVPRRPGRVVVRTIATAISMAVLVVLTGCKVEPRVDIVVQPDGSGTVRVAVTLDAEAMSQLGDPSLVRLDDIREGGWDVPAPETTNGSVTFRASKPFESAGELQRVLDEIGGAGGLFRDVRITIDDSWRGTTYRVTGSLRSTGSAEQFSDLDVAKVLDGLPLGRTPEELARDLGTGEIRLIVTAHLPGEIVGSGESTVVISGAAPTEQPLAVTSEVDKSAPLWWFLGASVAAVVALACVVLARRSRTASGSAPPDAAPPDAASPDRPAATD